MIEKFNVRRNVITAMAAFGTNLVLVFMSYRLVITVGGLEALGLWSSLMAWIFLIRLGDVGMATATVRFVARCDIQQEGPRVRSYVDTALLINLALFTLLSLLGYGLFSANLSHIVPGSTEAQVTAQSILPLLFVGFLVSNISGLVLGGLTGLHRGYQAALLGIVGSIVQLGVVLWGVPRLGLAGLAWGLICQHLVMIVSGWTLFILTMRRETAQPGALLPVQFSKTALREMLSFSLKTQFANLLNGLFEPLSKILIGRGSGLEILGLFELAYKVVALPRNAIVSGVQATVPSMTRLLVEDRTEARKLFNASERRLMRASLVLSSLVVLALPAASWVVLGRLDMTLWIFTGLLAIGFLGNSTGAVAYVLCIASGRAGLLILSSVAALAMVAVFVVLGGLLGGVIGSVAGVALSLAGGGLIVRYLGQRIWEHS